jgi:hypothetical protein
MRGFDCACGTYLEADNDRILVQQMRQHVDRDHADAGYTDPQLERMAEDGAYDVRSGDDDNPLLA